MKLRILYKAIDPYAEARKMVIDTILGRPFSVPDQCEDIIKMINGLKEKIAAL